MASYKFKFLDKLKLLDTLDCLIAETGQVLASGKLEENTGGPELTCTGQVRVLEEQEEGQEEQEAEKGQEEEEEEEEDRLQTDITNLLEDALKEFNTAALISTPVVSSQDKDAGVPGLEGLPGDEFHGGQTIKELQSQGVKDKSDTVSEEAVGRVTGRAVSEEAGRSVTGRTVSEEAGRSVTGRTVSAGRSVKGRTVSEEAGRSVTGRTVSEEAGHSVTGQTVSEEAGRSVTGRTVSEEAGRSVKGQTVSEWAGAVEDFYKTQCYLEEFLHTMESLERYTLDNLEEVCHMANASLLVLEVSVTPTNHPRMEQSVRGGGV